MITVVEPQAADAAMVGPCPVVAVLLAPVLAAHQTT
jgi:hypothetical protein